MEGPRLSIASSSSGGSSLDCSADESPFPSPSILPSCSVGSLVVNGDNNNIHHGNLTTFTYNQFIVPHGDKLEVPPVKISSGTHTKFFPIEVIPDIQKLSSDKEVLAGLQRRWCCLIGAFVSLSFIILLTTWIFSLSSFHRNSVFPPTESPKIEEVSIIPGDMVGAPRIMSRLAWVAQPPVGPMDNNTLPANRVIVCHTATDPCLTTAECALSVRLIQQFHVESRKWGDIAYNFLVGGDGMVYIGRGWDIMGAHTKGENNGTLGVAFIGTYIHLLPSRWQLEAFNKLLDVGVRIGKITKDYKLQAQCQLQMTAAPGLALARNMTSWPHFDTSLPISCSDGGAR